MRAPVKHSSGKATTWEYPDGEWLEHHYTALGKSACKIAREIGASHPTIAWWLYLFDIPSRTLTQACRLSVSKRGAVALGRNSRKAAGARARRLMRRLEVPEVCAWCHSLNEPLEVHHRDHDRFNNDPGNLQYLCRGCHLLETRIRVLLKQDKINLTCKDRTMVIEFKE